MTLGRKDREIINELLENVFTNTDLSLEELYPEINTPEAEEYYKDQCLRIKEVIRHTINTMNRTITGVTEQLPEYPTKIKLSGKMIEIDIPRSEDRPKG